MPLLLKQKYCLRKELFIEPRHSQRPTLPLHLRLKISQLELRPEVSVISDVQLLLVNVLEVDKGEGGARSHCVHELSLVHGVD